MNCILWYRVPPIFKLEVAQYWAFSTLLATWYFLKPLHADDILIVMKLLPQTANDNFIPHIWRQNILYRPWVTDWTVQIRLSKLMVGLSINKHTQTIVCDIVWRGVYLFCHSQRWCIYLNGHNTYPVSSWIACDWSTRILESRVNSNDINLEHSRWEHNEVRIAVNYANYICLRKEYWAATYIFTDNKLSARKWSVPAFTAIETEASIHP